MLRFLGRFAVFFCSKVPKMNGNAPFLSRFFRLNKGLKVGGDAPIFPGRNLTTIGYKIWR
jgi:hypothetical protein